MDRAPDFVSYVAIDWSGAKGRRHKGIAVAICDAGDAAPRLVERNQQLNPFKFIIYSEWAGAELLPLE